MGRGYRHAMSLFTEFTSLSYQTEICCNCGVHFAMAQHFHNEKRTNGGTFYCPNGHSQHYTKPRMQELQEQLEQKERELRAQKCVALAEQQMREKAERKLKRVSRGVCPCCNRTFSNLARHMKTKHADTELKS